MELIILCLFYSPEAVGVLCGAVYLICLFIFIPFPFWSKWWENGSLVFPHHEVLYFEHYFQFTLQTRLNLLLLF